MLSRHPTRLLTKSIAALQAFAVALTPPMLATCPCGPTAAGAPPSDGCCGETCCSVASEPCCALGDNAADCQNCSCSPPVKQAPGLAISGPAPADDSSDASPHFLAAARLADLGLHGAAWSTAFDREAPGGPPGMRLHALLSVWRN